MDIGVARHAGGPSVNYGPNFPRGRIQNLDRAAATIAAGITFTGEKEVFSIVMVRGVLPSSHEQDGLFNQQGVRQEGLASERREFHIQRRGCLHIRGRRLGEELFELAGSFQKTFRRVGRETGSQINHCISQSAGLIDSHRAGSQSRQGQKDHHSGLTAQGRTELRPATLVLVYSRGIHVFNRRLPCLRIQQKQAGTKINGRTDPRLLP